MKLDLKLRKFKENVLSVEIIQVQKNYTREFTKTVN